MAFFFFFLFLAYGLQFILEGIKAGAEVKTVGDSATSLLVQLHRMKTCPAGVATHSALGHLTGTINQENSPQANVREANPH